MNALTHDPHAIVRQATLADMEFGLGVCRQAYPDMPVHLTIPWVVDSLRRQDRLVLVSGYGVGIASLSLKHGFIKQAHLDILAITPGHSMQIVRFLRYMIDWGRASGAEAFIAGASTGIDFGPALKRASNGAAISVAAPTYRVSLEG